MVTMKFLYNECLQVCFSECLFILFSTWKIFWFGLDNVMWNKSLNEINLRCLLQGAFTSCSDGKRAASVGHKVCWNLIRCASHMSYFHCPQSRVCTGDVWAGSGWMDILWGGFFPSSSASSTSLWHRLFSERCSGRRRRCGHRWVMKAAHMRRVWLVCLSSLNKMGVAAPVRRREIMWTQREIIAFLTWWGDVSLFFKIKCPKPNIVRRSG